MSIGIWQVVLILMIVLIIFGAGKLPQVMGDVAKGVKSFKAGLKDDEAARASYRRHDRERVDRQEGRDCQQLAGAHRLGVRSMFDIGWSEMAVILMVALIVIGPKDLPRVARTIGKWTGKARGMAREFQRSIEDMAREAELQDIKAGDGQAQPGRCPQPHRGDHRPGGRAAPWPRGAAIAVDERGEARWRRGRRTSRTCPRCRRRPSRPAP